MKESAKGWGMRGGRKPLLRPPIRYTEGLPILERKGEILSALAQNQVVIIAGETGSGKTTQLPVLCLEAGRGVTGKIGCTQPRRIAAVSIAERVAAELGVSVGAEVGYKIRFGVHDTPQTALTFMTDGILLAEIEQDPLLRKYDTLIIDEAHERSLNIDFILGYLRTLLPKRPDLSCIISSATIDTRLFAEAFQGAPVIEVSGRLFPVELFYQKPDGDDDREGEEMVSYLDGAVAAVKDCIETYGSGNMLVFMPTERDIRETCKRLQGARLDNTVVLPLFARLNRREQEAIFATDERRKVIVATNIAETSITIPGIRFVIDTGLARISRYAPRLRTGRLPIEPISQASANQRKGRCGRVREGICIRLYDEKDFSVRSPFTTPEIARSNLAGVILSMIVHRLGDIETFPFIELPSRQAITDGYAQLRELGALDRQRRVTSLGKNIARFPLDPPIARMILAAGREGALREVLIIAAALSIVDPRERPYDKQEMADAMHKKFSDKLSDFMTYVHLWDAYHETWLQCRTQNKMRVFCKEHFLSYPRMREWHDVHQLLRETVLRGFSTRENGTPASDDAVHRSLLPGLLAQCAIKNEKGRYNATRGREVTLFPGSVCSAQKPAWIMCHAIVETSQLFARTVAPLQPAWLLEMGEHLATRTYGEPWFDAATGFVRASERITIFGLPVSFRQGVHYGRIDPVKSTAVFIAEALTGERLETSLPFMRHNRQVRDSVDQLEAKLRTRALYAGDAAIDSFYRQQLPEVTSVKELREIIWSRGNDAFLQLMQEDLLVEQIPAAVKRFPDRVTVGASSFPVRYVFAPGEPEDGPTLQIPYADAARIPAESVEWLLPSLWPEKIADLLRNLPKEVRKKLQPIAQRAEELANSLTPRPEPFSVALANMLRQRYGIIVDVKQLADSCLAPHLVPGIAIVDATGTVIASGKGAAVLSNIGPQSGRETRTNDTSFASFEQQGLTSWSCGDLPAHVEIALSEETVPLYGFPALRSNDTSVDLVVVPDREEAERLHRHGVAKLLTLALARDFAWVDRDLRFNERIRILAAPYGGHQQLRSALLTVCYSSLSALPVVTPRSNSTFKACVAVAHTTALKIGFETLTLLEQVLLQCNECTVHLGKQKQQLGNRLVKELLKDLERYISPLREGTFTFAAFRQYPRYLRAFKYRIDRAQVDPVKYARNRELLEEYQRRMGQMFAQKSDARVAEKKQEFAAMVEEFAISLFAQQEVRTRFPISEKRLAKKVREIEELRQPTT